LSGKVIDNRVDVSFAESYVEFLYQVDILLFLHWGIAFPLLIVARKAAWVKSGMLYFSFLLKRILADKNARIGESSLRLNETEKIVR
jgi:hypothetical protein